MYIINSYVIRSLCCFCLFLFCLVDFIFILSSLASPKYSLKMLVIRIDWTLITFCNSYFELRLISYKSRQSSLLIYLSCKNLKHNLYILIYCRRMGLNSNEYFLFLNILRLCQVCAASIMLFVFFNWKTCQ